MQKSIKLRCSVCGTPFGSLPENVTAKGAMQVSDSLGDVHVIVKADLELLTHKLSHVGREVMSHMEITKDLPISVCEQCTCAIESLTEQEQAEDTLTTMCLSCEECGKNSLITNPLTVVALRKTAQTTLGVTPEDVHADFLRWPMLAVVKHCTDHAFSVTLDEAKEALKDASNEPVNKEGVCPETLS